MNFSKTNTILLSGGLAAVIFVAALLFMPADSVAKVQGQCVNCHTMHNSQDGVGMVSAKGTEGSLTLGGDCAGCHREPRDNLLTLSCVGCHAMNNNGDALPQFDSFNVPQVAYDQSQSLAAGNFTYVFSNDAKGHNVHGFGSDIQRDSKFGLVSKPPGYIQTMDYSVNNFYMKPFGQPSQIMCAGSYGCHGNVDIVSQTMATQGSHHANDAMLKDGTLALGSQGSTSGTSYRFLSGVKGLEHATWEKDGPGYSTSSHNEYLGEPLSSAGRTTGDSQTKAQINSMSEFCARCHGNFHMVGGSVSGTGIEGSNGTPPPWIRHPSDVALPNATAPYSDYTTWELTAPIARSEAQLPDNSSSRAATDVTTANAAVVFCLSCHRAHASSEDDSLRFSYNLILTGGGAGGSSVGCFACHGDK